jgi:transposase
MAATHIRMMQKAMEQMNIKLQNVISDITGKSGQAIIKSILEGERQAEVLVRLLHGRIKASRQDVIKSLQAVWKEENLFELKQSFELYHLYRARIEECDVHIRKHLIAAVYTPKVNEIRKARAKYNKNNFSFDATEILEQIVGVDLTKIFGITDTNATEIISEIGLNMNKWPTEKNFTSWLNLAPKNRVSGGKILNSRTTKKKSKAGQIFKMAAYAVQRSKNWLAAFYHRIKARKSPSKAIMATARKIAIIFYKMIKNKVQFNPVTIDEYNQTFKQKQFSRLKKQAHQLGLVLVQSELVT